MTHRIWGSIVALSLIACGGAEPCPEVDEAALRARLRTELLHELAQEGGLGRGGAEVAGGEVDSPELVDEAERFYLDISRAPVEGPSDALVTIVAIGDYQCPFCGRAEPTIEELMTRYPGLVRRVWRHNPLPFHTEADPAAQAAIEAQVQGGDALFWRLHALLMDNQRDLSRADLERYAVQIGLNLSAFRDALDRGTHAGRVAQEIREHERIGLRGTPMFLINGRVVRGAMPASAFAEIIDEEIAHARDLVARGVGPTEVYARLMRDAIREVEPPEPAARPGPAAPSDLPRHELPVPSGAPSRGRANAPVTIQIVSDFQCPFCSRVLGTLDELETRYGDRIRFVWRDYPLPFHQRAHPAAQAAREVFRQAGNEAFWTYNRRLFENQRQLEDDDLVDYARNISGVNVTRLRRAIRNETHRQAVDRDMELVNATGVRVGTPSFFINGILLSGAQPVHVFAGVIDLALSEAGQNP